MCERRIAYVLRAGFCILSIASLTPSSARAAVGRSFAERPNVVVIMADDLGWMDLHCQGNELLDTPNVDRLAAEGMRLTDAYAAAPVCTPTRAAMMTGQAPARLAITNHAPGHGPRFCPEGSDLMEAEWQTYLALENVTLAERLQQAGYATGFVGKWHLSHRPGRDAEGPYEPRLRPEWQGFDVNVGGCALGGPPRYFEPYRIPNIKPRREGDYLPERLADESIAFLREHRDQPFFLVWWNYSVHYPIEAPKPLIDKYARRSGLKQPAYAAMIEGMDTAIGRVLRALDQLHLTDNTLLIFTSDNGSLFGNAPLRRNKGYLYEGGIRVPWIVRWPGVVKPRSVCSVPVISMDTYPTILEACGVRLEPGEALDGESILPLLRQDGTLKRSTLFFHYPNYAFHKQNRPGSAVREGDFKLIKRYDDSSVELYDLAHDLGETNNLASQRTALARDLEGKLERWLRVCGAKMPTRVVQAQ
jgi:arylsulfatase A-like enzyme